ncbi:helix-turn-helix domain-containing protein [Streptomyces sp. CA-111067]|uniref:helix-turn-helix domain-containing protein n=1 Tax=Streptomyces sp. CA-111067 TaxID=3240046 RepID=UPI003D98E51B
MSQTPERPHSVGQQIRSRRIALDLTQPALAQRVGIDPSTVSATERGLTEIQRGKRAAWERALELRPGTITRAYTDDTLIEPAPADQTPYADLTDPHERDIWEMRISEEDRRAIIDILRADRQGHRRPA